MANSASHTANSAERRGHKLAALFLRAKKSCDRLTAYSTAWALSKGWPSWTGKLPIVILVTILGILSLFSFIVLVIFAVFGGALLVLMTPASVATPANDNNNTSIFRNTSSQNDCSSSYHGPKDGYYFNNGNYYKNGYFED
ncbi:hypothetical protein [Serratia fonticola]